MKPEAGAFLRKSREFLVKARNQLDVMHYNDEAGRAAYLAGLHAAQALIFGRTWRVIKRHRGVQNELRRLTRTSRASTWSCTPSLAAPTISRPTPVRR